VVPPEPVPAVLLDADGAAVLLAAPDLLTAPPCRLAVDGEPRRTVTGWAGPWPVEQRWWAPEGMDGSWVQVACEDGLALLLLVREGRWWVMGIHD
jgi:protein ImuB